MCDVKACRICLNTDVKLFRYDNYYLKQHYEVVMGVKMDIKNLPNHFCYECAAMLDKFQRFRRKCYRGQKVLVGLLRYGPITLKSVLNIDRKSNKLKSNLDLIVVSGRVRTCLAKSTTFLQDEIIENSEVELNEMETVKIEKGKMEIYNHNMKSNEVHLEEVIDYNDPLENETLADYKKYMIANEKIHKKETITNNTKEKLEKQKINKERNDVSDNDSIDIDTDLISTDQAEESEIIKPPLDKKEETTKKIIKGTINKDKLKRQKKSGPRSDTEPKCKFELDVEYWLTIKLDEVEAKDGFKAKAQDRKYLNSPYKCDRCYRGFSKEQMLSRHFKLRHNEVLPFKCRFCSMRFRVGNILRKHLLQHYIKYKCLRCDLVTAVKQGAIMHNEYHNGVQMKCKHCGQVFAHRSTYYTHVRMYHRSEHVCTLCGASFVSAAGLHQHKLLKHVAQDYEAPQDQNEYCSRCDIKFETRQAFEEHLLNSAKHADEQDVDLMKPMMGVKRQGVANPTVCPICSKECRSEQAYKRHRHADHPGAPADKQMCDVCGAWLTPASLPSHLNKHTRNKLFTCDTCGQQFISKSSLTNHIMGHTNQKPVHCPLCDKRYARPEYMRQHYRTIHLKEPYPKRKTVRVRKKANVDISQLEDFHKAADHNMAFNQWTF